MPDKGEKSGELRQKLAYYEAKLAQKMTGFKGVVHENAASELRYQEVMVLREMISALKEEIKNMV